MRHRALTQGYSLDQSDYTYNAITLTAGVDTEVLTNIKETTRKQRLDFKLQAKGDGTGKIYLKFDSTQTDNEALVFNDNVLLPEDLADTLSNYSGSIYIKADNPIIITFWEVIK